MPLVPAVANRLRFAKETFRWLAFIGAIGALLGLGVVLIKSRPEPLAVPQKDGETLTLQNFQTASHGKGRMQLRVSGDSLTLTKTRLGGPFRLGFAQSLVVRNLTIETFPDSNTASKTGSRPLSFRQTWASLAPSFKQTLESLLSQRAGGGVIVSAEITPLTVIERGEDHETVLLQAASCYTKKWLTGMVCGDGVVRVEGKETPFAEMPFASFG